MSKKLFYVLTGIFVVFTVASTVGYSLYNQDSTEDTNDKLNRTEPETSVESDDPKITTEAIETRTANPPKGDIDKDTPNSGESFETDNTESYTNEYFPDLKINYPQTWEIDTTTYSSASPDLNYRIVALSKDNIDLEFTFSPFLDFPCGDGFGPDDSLSTEPNISFENGYAEYEGYNPTIFNTYGRDAVCVSENVITSNLPLQDVSDGGRTLNEYSANTETVDYYLSITVQNNSKGQNQLQTEIREIISGSELR